MSLNIGENVGAYRIVEQLGQGGMATVFKAYHAALDRYVAIKVLHPAFKEDPNFLARFQREARVVAKLEHPNIVPVYDYADHNGAPYLVMKFIEGETLKARLARGPINLQEGLHIIESVGAGLSYAHQQGILHRDIKPSNIMLARDGNIYLADFGLARIALAGESTLSTDWMLGTPHYMSPEQAKGVKDLDAGTDLYSLGVVIYELVVGRVPYSADTPFAIIHDHIFTPLPMPHTVNPNVPEAIERVLLKALAKDRADRYPDVATMVAAFHEAVAPLVASEATSVTTALPHSTPVSPSAVTPTAAATTRMTPPGATVVSPAAAAASTVLAGATPNPAAAPPQESAAKKGYTFKWWHALIGVVVIACCLFFALAALARNKRKNSATPTAAATASVIPSATVSPSPAQLLLAQAQQAFQSGDPTSGLKLLNQAVALDPTNPAVFLQAGDIALTHNLALPALQSYYVPGVALAEKNQDPLLAPLRLHASIGFYMAAADPLAADFFQQQSSTYPDKSTVTLASARFRIFHEGNDSVLQDLQKFILDHPDQPQPEILLLIGDYFLSRGETLRAAKNYTLSLEANPKRPVAAWIKMEAQCNLNKIRDQKLNAKLEASCADPASLLTGK